MEMSGPAQRPAACDGLLRALEIGLALFVILSPLPFGAVVPAGRLALELGALLLLVLWLVRQALRPQALPPLACRVGLAGLLSVCCLQTLPLGSGAVGRLSPLALEVRRESRPDATALAAESAILGSDPSLLDAPATLSLDPPATASALRTGAALCAVFLVATTVVAERGASGVALALLLSAAFQGLYGTLVLASGHPVIWNVPKKYYLDCATGTFVNRNHFAGFLAAALPAGLALAVTRKRALGRARDLRDGLLRFSTAQGTPVLMLGFLLAVAVAGLLLSFSRAGIALGVGALLLTVFALGRRGLGTRALAILLLFAWAVVPLAQIGADRLAARYARAGEDLASPIGRATVWRDTLRMVGRAPLLGVGFGCFASAYPLFRSPQVRARYEHAHNDALQLLSEGGIVAAALLCALLVPLLRELLSALAGGRGTIGVGLAAGLAVLALHALVDFNFHIPSNAASGAILAGALSGLAWHART